MPQSNGIKNCIIGCRVSDEIQLKGGSLDEQETAGRMLADRNGWNVIRVFKKPHSARTTDRDDIDEVVDYILTCKTEGITIHYYIFKCIDRLTRAGYTEYLKIKERLASIGVQIVDTYGVIQPEKNFLEHLGDFKYKWSVYSPTEVAEMLGAYGAEQEGRNILTRLIPAEIRLVQEGYSVRQAPDGLKNKTVFVGKKEWTIREANPERAHFFQKMFELRAGGMDDKEIVTTLNAMGFRTRKQKKWDRSDEENPVIIGTRGNKPLTVKQLQRYIQRTEYAGYSCEKWTHYQPVKMQGFDGIVSVEIFNAANRGKIFIRVNEDKTAQVLYNHSPFGKVKRLRNNPEYPFKFLPCHLCGKPLLGSAPRSKSGKPSPRYHCGGTPSRKHKSYSIGKVEFENNIKKYVEALKFEPSFLNSFELVLNSTYRKREKEVVELSSSISINVGNLKAEQAAALDTLTTTENPLVRKKLEDKIDDLEQQIQEAQNKRQEIEITETDIKSFVKYAKIAMEHPSKVLIDIDDMRAQRALFGLVFEEIPTYQEILNGTPKLSLVFKLSSDYGVEKSQLVTLRGIEPRFQP